MTMLCTQGTLIDRYVALAEATRMVEHHRNMIEKSRASYRSWDILFPHVLTIMSLAPTEDAYDLMVVVLKCGLAGLIEEVRHPDGAPKTFDPEVVLAWIASLTSGLEALKNRHDLLPARDNIVTMIVEYAMPPLVSPQWREGLKGHLVRLARARFPGDSTAGLLWLEKVQRGLFAAVPRADGGSNDPDRTPPHAGS